MVKRKLIDLKFPVVSSLKGKRFGFVGDDVLSENISISMQYIVFLISLETEYELGGAVKYSVFKTIVLHTASIIESLIHWKLCLLIKSGKVDGSVMGNEDKHTEIKKLYQISLSECICGVRKVSKCKMLSDDTNFIELNRAAKRCGLFDEALFVKSEKLRGMRNKIHLSALKRVDDEYSKVDVELVFGIAKDIIDRIQNY